MSLCFRQHMGKAISLIIITSLLIVLIPASAISPDIFISEQNTSYGEEYFIEFTNEITYEDWEKLEDSGLTPLRQISKNQILVWAENEITPLYSIEGLSKILNDKREVNFEFESATNTLLFSNYRVLLEPHLPKEGVLQVINVLNNLNLKLDSLPEIKDVGSMPLSLEVSGIINTDIEIDGVWKIEKVLKTEARNDIAASIIESGTLNEQKLWEEGLNGEGVLIAVADTGIDLDHACFRENSTTLGIPGDGHRKIQLINTTIDGWDSSNNSNFGHGTHIAGSLGCNLGNEGFVEGTSLSHGSKLLIQDIVNEEGWSPPENAELLFLEAAQNGAIIHSNSWGDNEKNYTKRSGDFDGWGREVPWSLIFVAPGNSGGQLLEPANARNVVAVGSTTKSENLNVVGSSSIGPTNIGTRGIFLVAPGQNIISAKSDGITDSFNNDTISMTGTSMATPIAASGAAIIQQMIEDGMFTNNLTNNDSLGFSPSGPLMKALLSLATTSVSDSAAPNPTEGWGILNLSEITPEEFGGNQNDTTRNIWIWDSYQYDGDWSLLVDSRINGAERPLDSLTENSWNGDGAKGPFLSTGEEIRWNFTINKDEDVNARLSWLAKPEPYMVDNLQLSIITSDGRISYGNDLDNDGYSELYPLNSDAPPINNETTVGINLNISELVGVEWIHVIIKGEYVSVGDVPNSIGIEGDRIGFGLVVKGISNETPVELSGGGFDDIFVEDVLGYTYVGTSGEYTNIEFNLSKPLNWDFTENPGELIIDLPVDYPKRLVVNLSNSPFGFEQILGLSEGAELPLCSSEEDSTGGVNTSARGWIIEEIWWPPELSDCKGNFITFNLDPKRFDAPDALKRWNVWVEDNTEGDFIVVESSWNLSSWENPWMNDDVMPRNLKCEYKFGNGVWSLCEFFFGEGITVPKTATKFDVKWSWKEEGGMARELIIEYPIPSYQINQIPSLNFEYMTEGENTLVIKGGLDKEIPIVLFSESGEHGFVNFTNNEWNLDNTSMSCIGENYWIMSIDNNINIDFEIGGNAEIENDGVLSISALKLDSNWSSKIINNDLIFLLIENEEEGHSISLPLKSFEMLELHGKCDEINVESSFLSVKSMFLVWVILSGVIGIFALVMRKMEQDLNKIGEDEES